MAREVRCNGCRAWFPADLGFCTGCGQERPAGNRGLRVAALNSNLWSQAEMGERERRRYRQSLHEEAAMCRRHGIAPGGYPTKQELARDLKEAGIK